MTEASQWLQTFFRERLSDHQKERAEEPHNLISDRKKEHKTLYWWTCCDDELSGKRAASHLALIEIRFLVKLFRWVKTRHGRKQCVWSREETRFSYQSLKWLKKNLPLFIYNSWRWRYQISLFIFLAVCAWFCSLFSPLPSSPVDRTIRTLLRLCDKSRATWMQNGWENERRIFSFGFLSQNYW